ncbi:WD40 repeat-like protein, partial [Neoconidiobolus thromboides FSU 785]
MELLKENINRKGGGNELGHGFIHSLGQWRQEPSFKNFNKLKTKKVHLVQEKDKFITCMAKSDNSHFIAVGAGSKRNNLFLSIDEGEEISWRSTFTTPTPIYSLSWSGSYILSGHWDGCISLLKPPLDFLNDPEDPDNKETRLLIKTQYHHKLETKVKNSRILNLEFSPTPYNYPVLPSTDKFHSLYGGHLFYWDVMNSKTPIFVQPLGENEAQASNWCPNYQSMPGMIAVGDNKGSMKIIDVRSNRFAFNSASFRHWNSINSLKWSPFVPYWLASAGNDGILSVWDIRYSNSPVMKMGRAINSLSSVDWSNSHSDQIMAASYDYRTYLYSLNQENNMGLVVADKQGYTSPITAITRSNSKVNRFYVVSDIGELGYYDYLNDVLINAIPHRIPKQQKDLYRCEDLIYTRNLKEASERLMELIQNSSGVSQTALDLLCESIQGYPNDKEIQSLKDFKLEEKKEEVVVDPQLKFKSDVEKFAYSVPFNFSRIQPLSVSTINSNFANASSNTFPRRLRYLIENKALKELLGLEEEIVNLLAYSYSAPIVDLVTEIIKNILSKYCSQALELTFNMLKKLLNLNQSQHDYSLLTPLIYSLFYPTVYDMEATNPSGLTRQGSIKQSPPARPMRSASRRNVLSPEDIPIKSLDRSGSTLQRNKSTLKRSNSGSPVFAQSRISELLLNHFKDILPMLQLEIEIQNIAVSSGSDTEKAGSLIIAAFIKRIGVTDIQNISPQSVTISSGAIKLFLNAMIQLKRYEEFLIYSTLLDKAFNNSDLNKLVVQLSQQNVVSKFNTKLDDYCSKLCSSTDQSNLFLTEDFWKVYQFLLISGVKFNFNVLGLEAPTLHERLKTFSLSFYNHALRLKVKDSDDATIVLKFLNTMFLSLSLECHTRPKSFSKLRLNIVSNTSDISAYSQALKSLMEQLLES